LAVRLRLTRVGSSKNPIWRVVAADGRSPRDGRVLEIVGRYNPQPNPSEIVLDRERVDHWIARGAQPSDTVRKLIRAVDRGAPPASAAAAPAAAASPVATAEADSSSSGEEADEAEATPDVAGDDTVTAAEATGDPAATDESASAAEAAPADEGDATTEA